MNEIDMEQILYEFARGVRQEITGSSVSSSPTSTPSAHLQQLYGVISKNMPKPMVEQKVFIITPFTRTLTLGTNQAKDHHIMVFLFEMFKQASLPSARFHPLLYSIPSEEMKEALKKKGNMQRLLYQDKSLFEGQVHQSVRHGLGTFTSPTQGVYSGQWHMDKKHGLGVFQQNNTKYVGQWEADQRHGYGTTYFADGGIFTGTYLNNVRSGFGIYTYPSGNQYFGYWADGKKTSHSLMLFANGENYEGDFNNDVREGSGVARYNGASYQGKWKQGLKHGEGVSILWNMNLPLYTLYQGEFEQGMRHGKGSYKIGVLPTPTPMLPNVNSCLVAANLGLGAIVHFEQYQGDWNRDVMHGHGKIELRSKDVIFGLWMEGRLVRILSFTPSPFQQRLRSAKMCKTYCDIVIKLWWLVICTKMVASATCKTLNLCAVSWCTVCLSTVNSNMTMLYQGFKVENICRFVYPQQGLRKIKNFFRKIKKRGPLATTVHLEPAHKQKTMQPQDEVRAGDRKKKYWLLHGKYYDFSNYVWS